MPRAAPFRSLRVIAVVLAAMLLASSLGPGATANEPENGGTGRDGADVWSWPVAPPFAIVRDFVAPAHAYGPGHRGIDIVVRGEKSVRAPDDGVVAFAGRVVDRDIVTIDHGGGIVSTLEPVEATVAAGERVLRGEVVGLLAAGGHAAPGTLHLGARMDGEYLNPLVLLGAMPRAVLLPYAAG
ncbi:MAG: M23 family metallopeptidase [Microbacterium sp.]|uniref:murein hydrolase activator EnvC family protein n=1 Tax=Microbacterium sp. TaxID=51671 RepID=UPI0027248CDE|nr:M23 family metallopeptidase [Microbacterium sp.]MDO8383712.1 M23 family metallopeptidase [Microbacterium sp.]